MASTTDISNVVDQSAIEGVRTLYEELMKLREETVKDIATLKELETTIKSATSFKELNNAVKEQVRVEENLIKVRDERSKTEKQISQIELKRIEVERKAITGLKELADVSEEARMRLNDQVDSIQANIKGQETLKSRLDKTKQSIKDLNDEKKKGKISTDEYSDRIIGLRVQEEDLKEKISATNQLIKAQAKEANSAEGSMKQISQQLGMLKKTYTELSAKDRESTIGKNLLDTIKKLDPTIKGFDARLGNFQRNVGNYDSAFSGLSGTMSGFGKVTKGLTGLLGQFGIAIGSVTLIKKAFQSTISATQDTADKYTITINEAKAATDYFWQAVASGDFSNFLSGMNEAIAAAHDYTVAMIEIENRLRAISVREADMRAEIAKERNVMRDQTKTNEERIAAGKRVQDMELQLLTVRREELQKTVDEEVKQAARQHGISEQQVLDFIKNYDLREEEINQANKLIRLEKELEEARKGEIKTMIVGDGVITSRVVDQEKLTEAQMDYNDAMKNTSDAQKEFTEGWKNYGKVIDPVRDKIAQAAIAVSNYEQQYQSNLSRVISTVSGLENQLADEATKSGEKSIKAQQDAINKMTKIEQDAINLRNDLAVKGIQDRFNRESVELTQAYSKQKKEIETQLADESKLTEDARQALHDALLLLEENYNADIARLHQEEADAYTKTEEARAQDIIDANMKAFEARKTVVEQTIQDELKAASELYAAGTLSREEYEKEKLAITREWGTALLNEEIANFEKLLESSELTADQRKSIENKLGEARLAMTKKLNQETIDDNEQTAKKQEDIEKEKWQAIKKLMEDAYQMFFDFQMKQIDANIAAIDRQLSKIDEWEDRELSRLEEMAMSEERYASEKKAIEQQAEEQRKALEEKRRQEEMKQAKWEKANASAQALINTYKEASKLLSQPWLMAAVIAAGLAQVALINGINIPAYEKGTMDHPGGIFLGGEKRAEYALTPSGNLFEIPEMPALYDAPKHTKVFPDWNSLLRYTQSMSNDVRIPEYSTNTIQQNNVEALKGMSHEIISSNKKVIQAIEKNKSSVVISTDANDLWKVAMSGMGKATSLNRNLKFKK